MRYKDTMLKGLFNRQYKMKYSDNTEGVEQRKLDDQDMSEYLKLVFAANTSPSPEQLHQFNNLVVEMADEIAKPKVTSLINILASFETATRGEVKQYKIPAQSKAKVRWSANGSGVDLTRVEAGRSIIATPATLSTGFYYEPSSLMSGDVENFRKLVNDVADAKVRLYMDVVAKLMQAAISSGKIPSANVRTGANLTLAQYNKLASTLARYGGKPIFIGDTLLIDYFAQQQATDPTIKNLLSDKIKEELLTSLNPTTIGRTTAVNLVNPFTDETNSKTELPVNVGYMMAGAVDQKPFKVVEYGALRQSTEQDPEDERIKIIIRQDAHVSLQFGQAIGYIKEDAAVTL